MRNNACWHDWGYMQSTKLFTFDFMPSKQFAVYAWEQRETWVLRCNPIEWCCSSTQAQRNRKPVQKKMCATAVSLPHMQKYIHLWRMQIILTPCSCTVTFVKSQRSQCTKQATLGSEAQRFAFCHCCVVTVPCMTHSLPRMMSSECKWLQSWKRNYRFLATV